MLNSKECICNKCDLLNAPMVTFQGEMYPDVLIVGSFPLDFDASYGSFKSRGGKMVKTIISRHTMGMASAVRPKVSYMYAVRCCPSENDYKVTSDTISKCSSLLRHDIDRLRPKIIVALGADAAKSLGLVGALSKLRGSLYPIKTEYGHADILVTHHPNSVNNNPGLAQLFSQDLQKSLDYVSYGFDSAEMDLETPTTFEDTMAALDRAERYISEKYAECGRPILVSLDTETTSLNPWDRNQRMIMISFSYKDDFGLAYPWNHRDVVFSDEQMQCLRDRTEEVFGSNKVYLAEHNAKFDTQWTNYHAGLNLPLPQWDTKIIEHMIDEDKKGEYGLKALTLDYFPGYGKYEKELEEAKHKIIKAKETGHKESLKKHTEESLRQRVDYWFKFSESERSSLAAEFVNDGHISMAQASELSNIKFRKLNGQMVPLKKCEKAINKILSSIPDIIPLDTAHLPQADEFTYEDIPIEILIKYAAIDALVTRKLVVCQSKRIAEDEKTFKASENKLGVKLKTKPLTWAKENITMPMCHLISKMEYKGVRLDREKTKKYISVIDRAIEYSMDQIYQYIGREFNVNSAELPKILFEELKLPVIKYTDKGAPSTDADTIKQLYENHDIPFLSHLLTYRKLEKQRNTYLMNWLDMSSVDGRIHASFNQSGTATYRLSSSKPNLQNVTFFVKEVPLEFIKEQFPEATKPGLNIKELFIPDPGFELYDLDISNAEMRILCAYSRDDTMISVFNDGKCMHSLTASGISDYSYDDIVANKEDKETPQYQVRQIGKKVNFGTIFCMGPQTLVNQLWSELRIKRTEEEAQGYLDGFFATYPKVETYINSTKSFAARFGFTFTFTGRRRRFPILAFSSKHSNRVGRQAVNARIQTTSNDLIQKNMIDLDSELITPAGGDMLLSVHDSMVFQLPEGVTGVGAMCDKVIIDDTARNFPWLPVKWKYDLGKGPNYGHAHEEVG